MDNNEFHDADSDEELSEKHSHLLKFVEKLDKGQRIKRPERREPTLQVSEFHLVNSGITNDEAVSVDELVKMLGDRTHCTDISKNLTTTKKVVSVLPKPLEKPAADKLKRAVGFENTTKELEKWNAIVTRNRTAPTQSFPLRGPPSPMKPNEFVKRFRVQSQLEKELIALESEDLNENNEKVNQFALTLEEIVQKRREAAKFRAQQSYKQAKAHRQKKIKSKKFHRIARNIKVKEQFNEFIKLQKVDPEGALEKLEQLNRARAEERMSLKHKNTSQWAKNKQIRAKYDKESRGALSQQLSISRELMQKVEEHVKSDDEVMEDETETLELITATRNNPWMNNVKTTSEIDEFVLGYRKYWEKIHEANMKKKTLSPICNADGCIPCGSHLEENYELSNSEIGLLTDTALAQAQQFVNIEETHRNDDIRGCNINKKKKHNCVIVSHPNNVRSSEDEMIANKNMIPKSVSKKDNSIMMNAGTSEWSIESINNNSIDKSLAIDHIFDAIDDNIKQRIAKKLRRVKRKLTGIPVEKSQSDDNPHHSITDLSFKSLRLRPELDGSLDETVLRSYEQKNSAVSMIDECVANDILLTEKSSSIHSVVEIDPNEFINVKLPYFKNQVVNKNNKAKQGKVLTDSNEEVEEDEEDEEDEGGRESEENISQRNIITEAFADDNVVDEFKKEKAEKNQKLELGNVDMRLPGWGVWGGNNMKHLLKRKRRFILKFPSNPSKNNENEGDVILIQDNSIIKKHQVNDLPHPFSSVSDFETSIRAPIGRNFIPENAHKSLIEPTIKTRLGKVIKPMDEDVLIKRRSININGKLLRR